MNLSLNDQAPQFTAPDQQGVAHQLQEYQGHWVLLYFYPKDDTPGCTIEACNFRDQFAELKQKVVILGVSGDSVESHQQFAQKYQLPFTILSDPHHEVIKLYGVDGSFFPKRTSFLINPEGKIARIYNKVNVKTHATQILKDLSSLS